jgi:PTH2 family peptidyl-tRNA hydrolase
MLHSTIELTQVPGKIAAQASHATLACYKALQKHESTRSRKQQRHSVLKRWEQLGQAKIAVQAKSEDELLLLQAQAISLGLCAKIIHDAGRTQIASGSATCLGIGPGPKSVIDLVTGKLKLL